MNKVKSDKIVLIDQVKSLLQSEARQRSVNITNNTNFNQNNIQININNYGHENLDYLTHDYKTSLLKIPYRAVPKLIKHIHFNPEHPENHNIKIPNKKQKFALIQRNGKWEYRDKKHVIENIVDNSYNILDEHFEEHHTKLKNSKREDFLRFQEMFEQDSDVQKQILLETEVEILNNQ